MQAAPIEAGGIGPAFLVDEEGQSHRRELQRQVLQVASDEAFY
jgi:hypothetical protein